MYTKTIVIYSFDELSKDSQRRAIREEKARRIPRHSTKEIKAYFSQFGEIFRANGTLEAIWLR